MARVKPITDLRRTSDAGLNGRVLVLELLLTRLLCRLPGAELILDEAEATLAHLRGADEATVHDGNRQRVAAIFDLAEAAIEHLRKSTDVAAAERQLKE